jgi:hypothetical protein
MAKLAKIKTVATNSSVEEFINNIADEQKRKDSVVLVKMMQKATGEKPKIWSNAMIGFGEIIVKSPTTGREVEWLKIGFAPRKANLSLYLTTEIGKYAIDLKKLGKYKTGGGCLYINKLSDVDMKVLEELIQKSVKKK